MNSFLLEQLQKNVMLFDVTTDQMMAWVGDWQEQVPELYNPNFQIFSVYAFWGAGIYLLWAVKKQMLATEEKDRLEELERIFLRAETKAEIATHLFLEKVISEFDSFFSRVAKWWQGEYNRKLNQLKVEDKKSELKLSIAYIFYRREQMFFAALAMERQGLRGTAKLVANLKSMSEFLVDPAIKSLCQEYRHLFKEDDGDPWYPEEFWWRKMYPFQESTLSIEVTTEEKTIPEEKVGMIKLHDIAKKYFSEFLNLLKTFGIPTTVIREKIGDRLLSLLSGEIKEYLKYVTQKKALKNLDEEIIRNLGKNNFPKLKEWLLEEGWTEENLEKKLGPAYNDLFKRMGHEDAEAWKMTGDALVESGEYDEAIECYDEALKINPKLAEAWNNKGFALCKLGEYPQAIECYDEALKINPDDDTIRDNKDDAVKELERLKENSLENDDGLFWDA